jgi:hypothetical protein
LKKQAHTQRVISENTSLQFKPTTNANSRKILEKRNPKEDLGQGLSYQEYLIQRGKAYKEKH